MCLKLLGEETLHGKKYRFLNNDGFQKSNFNSDKVQSHPVVDIFTQPSWCQASHSRLGQGTDVDSPVKGLSYLMQAKNTLLLNPLSLVSLNSVSCIRCHTVATPSAHTACLLGKALQTLIIWTVFLHGKNSPKGKKLL